MNDDERQSILRSVAEREEAAYARGQRRLHIAIGMMLGVFLAWAWGKWT